MKVLCTLPSGCILNVPKESPVVISFGSNEVEDSFWSKAKNNPAVKAWLGEGGFLKEGQGDGDEGVDQKPSSDGEDSTPGLTGMTVAEAEVVIAGEEDEALLGEWMEADTRKGVHNAIIARIEELAES